MNDDVDPALVAQILASVSGQPLELAADCGCQFGTVGDVFMVRPCSPTCKRYRWVMAEGKRQGKPWSYGYEGDRN